MVVAEGGLALFWRAGRWSGVGPPAIVYGHQSVVDMEEGYILHPIRVMVAKLEVTLLPGSSSGAVSLPPTAAALHANIRSASTAPMPMQFLRKMAYGSLDLASCKIMCCHGAGGVRVADAVAQTIRDTVVANETRRIGTIVEVVDQTHVDSTVRAAALAEAAGCAFGCDLISPRDSGQCSRLWG